MSEQSILDGIDMYISETSLNEKDKPKTKKVGVFKILKTLVVLLLLLLIIEAIAYFIIIPNTTASILSFSGLQTLDAHNLHDDIEKSCGKSWYHFDTSLAASRILTYSAVESVSVQKQFPNKVIISVTERTPVAVTLTNVNARTVPALIDKNGVVFALADEELSNALPLITGFGINTFFEGMRLESKFSPLLKQVAEIQKSNASYFQVISEILISPKEFDNYELIIYPVHTKTRVLVDRNFTEDALKYMMVALDVVKSVSPDVSELDLRYGTVSYRIE